MDGQTHVRELVPHGCRLGVPGDLAYVTETWLRTDPSRRHMRAKTALYEIRMVLCREDVQLRVAHDVADGDAILAWAVVDGDKVVWAYTREPLRRMGLQSSLLAELVDRVKEYHEVSQVPAEHRDSASRR